MYCRRRFVHVWLFLLLAFLCVSQAVFAATKLQFVTYGDLKGWPELMDEFHKANPDIIVEVQTFPLSDYPTKVATMVAGGAPPDIVQTIAQTKAQWVTQGIIADVTDRWANSELLKSTHFFPVMLSGALYEGRYYGVPYDFGSHVYYLNLDWMAERGVVPPPDSWNWEDFKQLTQKLTDPIRGVYGTNHQVRSGDSFELAWVYNWTGHDWFDEKHEKVLVDQPAHIQMLEYWLELQNVLQVTPGAPGGFRAVGSLYTGAYAMWQGWVSYGSGRAADFTYNWRMALQPAGPAAQKNFAHAHMFSICALSTKQDAAWRFLEWVSSYEGQKAQVDIRQRSPLGPYMDLWNRYLTIPGQSESERTKAWVTTVLYGQDYVRNFEYHDTWYEEQAIMRTHLGNIFNNHQPVGNEMITAAEALRALLITR
ncbi:MAG: ABC transporter substrate-binding protein [Limnochordia bacterium]|jgi:multiple sugar transport system substrate-binding protein